MNFWKNGQRHGKVTEFRFWSRYFVCLKTRNIFFVIEHTYAQKAGFSAFLNHGKFKLPWKSHGKEIEFY